MRWYWLALALVIIASCPFWLAVVLLALEAGAVLLRDLRRYPRAPCRTCGGEGAFFSPIFGRFHGRCTTCKGRKVRPRPMLRITDRDTYDDIKAGKGGKYH